MSSRGGRGRGADKSHRGGGGGGGSNRYDTAPANNNGRLNTSINSAASAPPPSIDQSPVRNGAGGAAANNSKGGKGSHRGSNSNSAINTPVISNPPEPVGPSPTKVFGGPQTMLSPLSTDSLQRTHTPTPMPRGGALAVDGHGSVSEREVSTSYERPPIAPQQRSSFEVTASPISMSGVLGKSASGNLVGIGAAPNGGGSGHWNGGSGTFSASPNQGATAGPTAPANPNLNLGNGPVDRDAFMAAKTAIHNAPRPVLAALLTSLLDDYPALAPVIKFRYDRAMSAVASQQMMAQQQQQQQIPPSGFWNGAASSAAVDGNSPARKRSFRGRGGHDDEQQVCGVHGALRSTKHLRLADNGMLECVPGFHCLESSKENSNCVSPTKGERELSSHALHANAGAYMPPRQAFSTPATPPPSNLEQHYAVQGLFHAPQQHQMHGGGMGGLGSSGMGMNAPSMGGMVRQQTQPPNAMSAMGGMGHVDQGSMPMTLMSSGSNNHAHSAPPPRRTDDDDNLEELLKNLHLATGM